MDMWNHIKTWDNMGRRDYLLDCDRPNVTELRGRRQFKLTFKGWQEKFQFGGTELFQLIFKQSEFFVNE